MNKVSEHLKKIYAEQYEAQQDRMHHIFRKHGFRSTLGTDYVGICTTWDEVLLNLDEAILVERKKNPADRFLCYYKDLLIAIFYGNKRNKQLQVVYLGLNHVNCRCVMVNEEDT